MQNTDNLENQVNIDNYNVISQAKFNQQISDIDNCLEKIRSNLDHIDKLLSAFVDPIKV